VAHDGPERVQIHRRKGGPSKEFGRSPSPDREREAWGGGEGGRKEIRKTKSLVAPTGLSLQVSNLHGRGGELSSNWRDCILRRNDPNRKDSSRIQDRNIKGRVPTLLPRRLRLTLSITFNRRNMS